MSDLDPVLRQRLQTLARTEENALDEPARTRIRAAVRARAGQREARVRWPYAGLAAALLLLVAVRVHAPAGVMVPRVQTPAPHAASAVQAAKQCAPPESGTFVQSGASRRLELTRARVVADADAVLSVRDLQSCALELTLETGRAAVHARDLAGGSLVVHTPLGTVSVRGTLFSVDAGDQELVVAVAEGQVAVGPRHGAEARVSAGQVLRVARDGRVTRSFISHAELTRLQAVSGHKKAMRSNGGIEAAAPEAPPSAPASERVWQQGAPLSPPGPELPTSFSPDGRPMQKPRVVHDEGDAP